MKLGAEVEAVAVNPLLQYPIREKAELLEALSHGFVVRFRDKAYDAAKNASLLPQFFFPINAPDDFTAKVGELLVARGLTPCPPRSMTTDRSDFRVSSEPPATRIEEVLARIEVALLSPVRDGFLPVERVDALDIIMHGLDFSSHSDGLELWREALWRQRLDGEARKAIMLMADYVTAAAQRGEWAAISAICDCLDDLLEPDLLASRHIGGTMNHNAKPGTLASHMEIAERNMLP